MILGEKNDIPRCDRMFEIHKEYWFRRKEMPKFQEYWEYLCQMHDFPIYMQKVNPEIPNAFRYPYEEICEDLFAGLLRMGKSREETRDTYLTSSAAFMVALAIHEKFERIEIYGIGMETKTEYGYQKSGFECLLGIALGRGIQVVNQWNSPICKAAVYGYDAVPYVEYGRLIEIQEHYHKCAEDLARKSKTTANLANTGKMDKEKAMEVSDIAQAYAGAYTLVSQILDVGSEYHSRQALEVHRRTFEKACEAYKAETNAIHGQVEHLFTNGQKGEQMAGLWQKWLDARASMFANLGAVQALDNMIGECDLFPPFLDIVLTIKDV